MLCGGILLLLLLLLLSSHIQGAVISGPNNVTYLPDVTPLPIELTCNVTGVALWRVNDTSYTLTQLTNGELPGHNRTGTNILVNSPVNNTEYICISLTNDGDVSSDSAYIIIAGVPAIVPDVAVDNNTTNINGNNITLTLSWGEPFNNLDPIVNYTVSCSGDVTCPPNFTITDNITRSYTITNLTPMTNYTFSVVASNSIGSGEADAVIVTTPPGLPLINNITVSGNVCFETSVNISWNSPSISTSLFQETLNVTMSEVSYQGIVLSTSSNVLFMFNTSGTFYNFTNFNESTNYIVRIASVNIFGNGIYNMSTFYIPDQDDFALGRVTINDPEIKFNASLNQTDLLVTWEPLVNRFCEVLYYTITLSATEVPSIHVNVSSSSTLIARFPNISNNTEYSITIVAVNQAGNGTLTLKMIIPTTDIAPSSTTTTNASAATTPAFVICLIILAVILIIIHTSVGVLLRYHYEGYPDKSIGHLVLLVILGVLSLGISNLIWYIYLKCQSKYKEKTKYSSLLFVSMSVSHILPVGLPALLWCLLHPCCVKKKEAYLTPSNKMKAKNTKSGKKEDERHLTSPSPSQASIVTQAQIDILQQQRQQEEEYAVEYAVVDKSKKMENPIQKQNEEILQQQQQQQQEYAVVDKSKKVEKPNQKQDTELNYLGPDDLEIQKGPEIRFKTDHTVQYGQFDDTT